VVRDENWEYAASRTLLLLLMLLLGIAQAIVNDHIVVIDAALHLLLSASGQKGKGSGSEKRRGNVRGALHGCLFAHTEEAHRACNNCNKQKPGTKPARRVESAASLDSGIDVEEAGAFGLTS
jgi:hypothetical protein